MTLTAIILGPAFAVIYGLIYSIFLQGTSLSYVAGPGIGTHLLAVAIVELFVFLIIRYIFKKTTKEAINFVLLNMLGIAMSVLIIFGLTILGMSGLEF